MGNVNIEALKRKIAQLEGKRVQVWKPEIGTYKIRALPWPDATPEAPLKELYFYYLGKRRAILAPFQFNKPDPINDLLKKLWAEKTPESKEMAKKLRPALRGYLRIIDRGNPEAGVQLWSFGPQQYSRLLSFIVDGDDFMAPDDTGIDLKVKIVAGKGGFSKTKVDTIDLERHASALHSDPETAQKWIDSVPDLAGMYELKDANFIKSELEAYLSGDEGDGPPDKQEGTSRGETASDELEKVAGEIEKIRSKAPEPEKAPVEEKTTAAKGNGKAAKAKPTKKEDDEVEAPKEGKYKDLDAAFDSLLEDE